VGPKLHIEIIPGFAENRTKLFACQARTAVTSRPIYLHTSLPKGSATYMKKYSTLYFYPITTNRLLSSHVIWQQCYRPLLSYFILVLSLLHVSHISKWPLAGTHVAWANAARCRRE